MSSQAANTTLDEEEAHFYNVVATFRKYGPYAVILVHWHIEKAAFGILTILLRS